MSVKVLENEDEFQRAMVDSVSKYAVIKFHATWCGPCKMIAPKFKKMAKDYSDKARFYSIDVDEVQTVAKEQEVKYMPTFIFYKNAKRLGEYVGAKEKDLAKAIEDAVGITKDREEALKAKKDRELREQQKREMEKLKEEEEPSEETVNEQQEDTNTVNEQQGDAKS